MQFPLGDVELREQRGPGGGPPHIPVAARGDQAGAGLHIKP